MHFQNTIVGAGPVGLTLALHFKKLGIPFALFEALPTLRAHPSAHYINSRSMEIFHSLFNLKDLLQRAQEPIDNFKHYTYLRRIGEQPFHQTDQTAIFASLDPYSFLKPIHLPQSELVKALFHNLQDHQHIYFNTPIQSITSTTNPVRFYTKQGQQFTTDYLYGCDGLNGITRKAIGTNLLGQRDIQSFLNLHFESKQLVHQILPYQSMLTFVYNSKITAVLIFHQKQQATFNLQIPLDLLGVQDVHQIPQKQLQQLVCSLTTKPLTDIKIKHVGLWRMGAVVAQRYYKDNVVILGDAAHSVPPAGGFGMNIGIQDAHNLAFKNGDFELYQQERKTAALSYMNIALQYYQKSLEISQSIGYNYNHLKTYQGFAQWINMPRSLYLEGIRIGGSHLETNYFCLRAKNNLHKLNQEKGLIPMVFPKEENQYAIPNILCEIQQQQIRLKEYLHKLDLRKDIELTIGFQEQNKIEVRLIEKWNEVSGKTIIVRPDLYYIIK